MCGAHRYTYTYTYMHTGQTYVCIYMYRIHIYICIFSITQRISTLWPRFRIPIVSNYSIVDYTIFIAIRWVTVPHCENQQKKNWKQFMQAAASRYADSIPTAILSRQMICVFLMCVSSISLPLWISVLRLYCGFNVFMTLILWNELSKCHLTQRTDYKNLKISIFILHPDPQSNYDPLVPWKVWKTYRLLKAFC